MFERGACRGEKKLINFRLITLAQLTCHGEKARNGRFCAFRPISDTSLLLNFLFRIKNRSFRIRISHLEVLGSLFEISFSSSFSSPDSQVVGGMWLASVAKHEFGGIVASFIGECRRIRLESD